MIEFRVRSSRSWLDAKYGKILAHDLAERLVARCAGQQVLKIELTYQREEYSDPADLYYRAGEHRHVRRFIESLRRYLKTDLTGRWLCKMEFQQGGWVHWHLLLLGVSYIDHTDLMNLWGHGYVWVRRADEAELRYVCKYIAKDGEFPAFLYLRPIRSVKIIRVSPGFWGESTSKPKREDDDDEPAPIKLPAYVTIGEMIERGAEAIVCRDDDGRYVQVDGDPWDLFGKLRRMGGRVVGSEKGWLQLRGVDLNDVRRLRSCEGGGLRTAWAGGARARGRAPAQGGRKAAALHLIDSGNPPVAGDVIPLRKWMKRVIEWQLGWCDVSAAPA
jgi:hypothetical protein